MTGWLLDTNALIWFWNDPARLSGPAREILEDPRAPLIVSTVALWEIELKRGLGKLRMQEAYPAALEDQGFETLAIEPSHALALARLPLGEHRDPFDRMLVAQAKVEMLPIISADAALDQYGIARLW